MPPADEAHPVAVQVALLTGKIDQVISDHERRLASMEDWQKWAGRLIIGAVVLAVLGAVMATRGTL